MRRIVLPLIARAARLPLLLHARLAPIRRGGVSSVRERDRRTDAGHALTKHLSVPYVLRDHRAGAFLARLSASFFGGKRDFRD